MQFSPVLCSTSAKRACPFSDLEGGENQGPSKTFRLEGASGIRARQPPKPPHPCVAAARPLRAARAPTRPNAGTNIRAGRYPDATANIAAEAKNTPRVHNPRPTIRPGDASTIQFFLENAEIKKSTANQYKLELENLSAWLQKQPGEPTLDTIAITQGDAKEDDNVKAYRRHFGAAAKQHIAAAVNALRTGNVGNARRTIHPDDEAVIQLFLKHTQIKNRKVAQQHAYELRNLAIWLRKQPGRPTLDTIAITQGDPKEDDNVKAYRQHFGAAATKHIAAAVKALRTGRSTKTRKTVHPDDEAVIQLFLKNGKVTNSTAEHYASMLRGFAIWLRGQPGKPTLDTVAITQGDARKDADVQKYRGLLDARAATHIAATVNALRTGRTGMPSKNIHPSDEKVVRFFRKHGKGNGSTIAKYALKLLDFAIWLREQHGRLNLGTIAIIQGDAKEDDNVQAYRRHFGAAATQHIVAAVKALRATMTARLGDDAAPPEAPPPWIGTAR